MTVYLSDRKSNDALQCIKIIAGSVVNSLIVARFNLLVTWQESATQSATILVCAEKQWIGNRTHCML